MFSIENLAWCDNVEDLLKVEQGPGDLTTLKKGRHDIEKYISWAQHDIKVNSTIPYFYHPVKKLIL
jgi:hypothetical protein